MSDVRTATIFWKMRRTRHAHIQMCGFNVKSSLWHTVQKQSLQMGSE